MTRCWLFCCCPENSGTSTHFGSRVFWVIIIYYLKNRSFLRRYAWHALVGKGYLLLRLTVYLYWGILVKEAMIMIKSFGDKITEKIFNGERVRQVSLELEKGAVKNLDMINFVTGLEQLRIPPGNRLEKLSGDLAGFYSIRINDQFRIAFKWINDHAYEVQLRDYH